MSDSIHLDSKKPPFLNQKFKTKTFAVSFAFKIKLHQQTNLLMSEKKYFTKDDLKNFGKVTEWQEEYGKKFFDYYNSVFKEGALTEREKALIALAVAHAIQCPYCIDAYSSTCLVKGADEEQMMEAVHVAAAIKSGTTLVYATQMMNHVKKLSM